MSKNWSTQQKAIFEFFATGRGNLVVRARAGTGKTTTIIEALNHAPNDKALLAAFNKRIAVELQGRISSPNVEAKTLHALGFAFIRRQWQNVTVDAVVDTDRARAAAGKTAPDEMVAMVKKLAGLLKSCAPFTADLAEVGDVALAFDCIPDEEWEEEGWDVKRVAELAIIARDAAKERDERGRISFDDMVFIPIANGFVRPWFTLVVVDEAQDMNYSQLLLARRACKRTGRIVVVGDDRQAIYGFRGADSNGIDRLKEELEATELGLTVTYRCGKAIVDVATKIVPDFTAAPGNPTGTVDAIQTAKLCTVAKPGDFVLSRKNAPLMATCLSFLRQGVPARIEGRDVAASLRTIVAKFKAKSVPNFISRVGSWKAKQITRMAKLDSEVAEAKIAQIEDQAATLIALAEGCASVDEIFLRLDTMFGDSDSNTPRNMVVCSSIHKAKGLETDRVFVLADTFGKRGGVEEANLYYVAVTRAKMHLTMVREKV